MAIGQSLRASIASVVPTWLQNTPGFRNLYSYVYVLALLGDCLREIAWEGRMAAYPGVGTPTANPYIGASRGLLQGPNESNALFAARCLAFRSTWLGAGSQATLASTLQAYLVGTGSLGAGVYPVVKVVDRFGHTVTANADRSLTTTTISWAWDSSGGWVDDARWESPFTLSSWTSDVWIVIQDPFTHYASFADTNWLNAWNTNDQTIDSLCSQAIVDGVYATIAAFKGAHFFVRNVTWVPNVAAFAPAGNIGNASLPIAGVQTRQRDPANAYWDPPGGG
jgi:hypothetical protein